MASIQRPPEGGVGSYKVVFVLGIPGKATFTEQLNDSAFIASGESLLYVRPGTYLKVDIENNPDVQEVWIYSNDNGALSRAQIMVDADSFLDAERKAHDALSFILSWWSYAYSVAIDIKGYKVTEERTESQKWVFNALGRAKAFDVNAGLVSNPKFRVILSAYRDALGTGNPFYQVVCFFNVLEGLYKIRAQRLRADRDAGRPMHDPGERMESDIRAIPIGDQDRVPFEPYLGRKFTRIRDELRSTLRNAVAHLDPDGESFVADEFEDLAMCRLAIPVLKYLCDVMLNLSYGLTPSWPHTSRTDLPRIGIVVGYPHATEGRTSTRGSASGPSARRRRASASRTPAPR